MAKHLTETVPEPARRRNLAQKEVGGPAATSAKSLPGIKRGDSVTAAFERLRQLIVQGQIAPGSWVVESELASRMGLSRTPIRAALQLLQREGFLLEQRADTKSKMRVAPLTKEDVVELHRIMAGLERIAGLATANLPEPARRDLCLTLTGLNRKFGEVAKGKTVDARSAFEIDTVFHGMFVKAGAGPRLIAFHEIIRLQIERYGRFYGHHDLGLAVSEHEAIVEAIAKGNAKATERAIEDNWRHGSERIGKLIDRLGERGSF
jgi:DNA-binding GntR family transcriptional regulator